MKGRSTLPLLLSALALQFTSSDLYAAWCVRDLPDYYVPGRTLTVTLTPADCHDWYCGIYGFDETIPPGWTFIKVSAPAPDFTQMVWFDQGSRTIHWRWSDRCPPGLVCIEQWPPWYVSYDVTPPPDGKGEGFFAGFCPDAPMFPIGGDSSISDGPGPLRYRPHWATIEAIIDTSSWGDTVMVSAAEAPFVENVVMKPGVNLVGYVEWPSYQPPVIEAASPSEPAIIAAPYTNISGFVIRSAGIGIRVSNPTVEISNCVITGTAEAAIEYVGTNEGKVSNCSIVNNSRAGVLCYELSPNVVVSNSILFANVANDVENCTARFCLLEDEIEPGSGENNIFADPMFVDPATGDYRLLRDSPCIDAGDSSVIGSDDKDILGKARILFGGKANAVDMGAYEHWFASASPRPDSFAIALSWSNHPGKAYSVFFSDDMVAWQPLAEGVPASDATATVWPDPVGWPPTAPMRFYRISETE